MIKGIATVVRKPGMADDAFHRYWRDVHGPLALQMSRLRRYVQSHRCAPLPGFEACPYDGVARSGSTTSRPCPRPPRIPNTRPARRPMNRTFST